jgi:hypothetical protein
MYNIKCYSEVPVPSNLRGEGVGKAERRGRGMV